MALSGSRLARRLRELIDALDRRGPHSDKAAEANIARDAAALRAEAVQRLTAFDDETPHPAG